MASALITIGATTFAPLKDYKWDKYDIVSADSGRDESATMHKTVIARKRKLFCTWQNITVAQAAAILAAVEATTDLSVTFLNLATNTRVTMTATVGDRSGALYNAALGLVSVLTVNFIEN